MQKTKINMAMIDKILIIIKNDSQIKHFKSLLICIRAQSNKRDWLNGNSMNAIIDMILIMVQSKEYFFFKAWNNGLPYSNSLI